MGNFFSDAFKYTGVGMLMGAGDDDASRTDGVKYPEYYEDPNFKGSQDFLSQYSKDLLNNGPNAYYAPIGEYGTQEFMNAMKASNASTLAGLDAVDARLGRARGGRVGEVAAAAMDSNNAKLMYDDYTRAMKGREMFLNTGLNVQTDVRKAGGMNQASRNSFNQAGAEFDWRKAIYGDEYDAQGQAAMGKMLSGLAPIAGAGIGFMVGGPAGASVGYGIGNTIGGGSGAGTTPQWLDTITQAKTASPSAATVSPGVSSYGAIGNGSIGDEELMKLFSGLHG